VHRQYGLEQLVPTGKTSRERVLSVMKYFDPSSDSHNRQAALVLTLEEVAEVWNYSLRR